VPAERHTSTGCALSQVLCCALLQADQADLRAFEQATASARSQGLFFKNLYEPELDEEQQEAAGSSGSTAGSRSRALLDPAAARKAAAVVASSAEEEVSSPFRMYLFGAMAAVLAAVVAQGGLWAHARSSRAGVVRQVGKARHRPSMACGVWPSESCSGCGQQQRSGQ
jgi:hypothetical protein